MLATPVIGFIIGAGGYLSFAVLRDTYTGKMPGPKEAGYFIGIITAATVIGLASMSRKQGYLAEEQKKYYTDPKSGAVRAYRPKQDYSKLNLEGYTFKGRPANRKSAEQATARVRTMSGKPVSQTLRKMKHDKNITPEEARERKEIRAEAVPFGREITSFMIAPGDFKRKRIMASSRDEAETKAVRYIEKLPNNNTYGFWIKQNKNSWTLGYGPLSERYSS